MRRSFICVRSRRGHKEIFRLREGAIDILDSENTGHQQLLVKDLVDDDLDGYGFILAAIDTSGQCSTRSIPAYVEPFLKVITHLSILDCLSVNSFVGTMYATFGGPNGDRAIGFLESVCRCMINSGEHNDNNQTLVTPDMVKLLLNALYQLLYRVRRARFHDDLPLLLSSLYELVQKIAEVCSKANVEALDSIIEIMRPTNGKPDQRGKSMGLESRDSRRNTAREFLADALHLCDELSNCEELREKIEEINRLPESSRHEEVTPEELASIKIAMVGGRGGIATNSGHWYNCINGHPFAIGECGMPMQLARCPECGALIGGYNHQAVEGVSRAEHMK